MCNDEQHPLYSSWLAYRRAQYPYNALTFHYYRERIESGRTVGRGKDS